MSQSVFPVVGAPGTIQPRLEIRDLAKNPYQWSLFIRAYFNIQEPDYKYEGSTAPSWKEMAGIHGMPYAKWSGDPNGSGPIDPKKQWSGYCHHRSALFPTWHRIVVLLVEQAICAEAAKIVRGFADDLRIKPEEAKKWIEASEALRFPFWDWTLPDTGINGIPSLITSDTITISDPFSVTITPKNPLHSYKLDAIDRTDWENSENPEVPYYFKDWIRTYRWPDNPKEREKTQDQYDKVKQGFNRGIDWKYLDENDKVQTKPLKPYYWLVEQIYNLFMLHPKEFDSPKYHGNLWDLFAHSKFRDLEPKKFKEYIGNSLENPHDMVHLLIGGYGHMMDNNYAAYDPIFFLHHCNVDRIYAFWAFVYSDTWMDKGFTAEKEGKEIEGYPFEDNLGTFDHPRHSNVDHLTHLTPFRAGSSGNPYWASDGVKTVQALNYTYPPLAGVNINRKPSPIEREAYRRLLALHFYNLHDHSHILVQSLPSTPRFLLNSTQDQNLAIAQGYRYFTVIVKANEWAFDLSHSIELFIPGKARPKPWGVEPDAPVGGVYILKRGDTAGQIVLDNVLVVGLLQRKDRYNEEASEDEIVELLKTSFSVRVLDGGRRVLAAGRLVGEDAPTSGEPILAGDARIPEMTLLSASRHFSSDTDSPGPIHYRDWQDHGDLSYSWSVY